MKIKDLSISHYNRKVMRDSSTSFNNIYVENFPITWDEAKLRQIFSEFGEIKSLVLITREMLNGKEGQIPPFALICYDKPNNLEYGRFCAWRAINNLDGKEFDGLRLYVKKAFKKESRDSEK